MNNKERVAKRQLRKVRGWTIFGILVGIAVLVIVALKAPAFNVTGYEIEGNHYYSDDEIINMGNCNTGETIFTGVDCGDIRDRLMKDPYMVQVKVRRKIPNTIVVNITERAQVAGVVFGESFVVIDSDGIVLRKTTVDPKVTVLRGMNISKMELGEPIEVEEPVLLRQCMDMISTMQANNMYFKSITISEGEVKAYVLDSLVVRGMADNILESLKNKDIQLVVQELFEQGIERGTIKVTGDNYVSFTPQI